MDAYERRDPRCRDDVDGAFRRGAPVQPARPRGVPAHLIHREQSARAGSRLRARLLPVGVARAGVASVRAMSTADRRRAVLASLPDDIDAALITKLVNVRYLTGFTGSNGAVLVTRHGDDVLATD